MDRTTAILDETVLLDRCKRGDERALKELIGRSQQPVFALVICLTGCDPDTAYEITVSSVVGAMRAIHSSGNTHAWMQTLLPLVVEGCRKVKPVPSFHGPEIPNLPRDKQKLLLIVQQALAALPFETRLLLLLREQMNLRYDDMAIVVGTPATRVRVEMSEARKRLRDKVADVLGQMR